MTRLLMAPGGEAPAGGEAHLGTAEQQGRECIPGVVEWCSIQRRMFTVDNDTIPVFRYTSGYLPPVCKMAKLRQNKMKTRFYE